MGRILSKQSCRDVLLGLGLLLAALALVVWPGETMSAMKDGLALCGNVIIPSLFPCHRLDNGKRDAPRPGQHTHDHLAHEDGGQIAVQDIIGVDGAVDRPVARETIDNKSDQSQGFHKNYHAGAAPAQIGMKTEAAKFPVFLYNVFERHTTKHGSRGGGQGVSLSEKY